MRARGMRRIRQIALVTLAAMAAGCGTTYMRNRGNDAKDIIELGVTTSDLDDPGFALYMDGWNVIPLGVSKVDGKYNGLGSRQFGHLDFHDDSWGALAWGSVETQIGEFDVNDPHQVWIEDMDKLRAAGEPLPTQMPRYNQGFVRLPMEDNAPPYPSFCPCGRKHIHLGYIGVFFGIHFCEALDFVLGWTTLDIMRDDIVRPAPPPPPIVMPPPARAPAPPVANCVETTREGGMVSVVSPVLTGNRATAEVLLEKKAPAEVAVGHPFDYEFKVTNLTCCDLAGVVLTEMLPREFKFIRSVPKETSIDGESVKWTIGVLKAKESRTVRVTGMYTVEGTIVHCGKVEYWPRICIEVVAVKPALQLVKTAPAEVSMCEPIPMKLVVTNTGTGVARNTKVSDQLPDGLLTADGKSQVTFDAGDLATGQSREFSITAKATKTGKLVNTAIATADGGLKAQASAATVVRMPVLTITKKASRRAGFLGQSYNYDIVVTNKGDYPSVDTVIEDEMPAGLTFLSASEGGQLTGNKVVWNIGTLAPNATKNVSVRVQAAEAGTMRNVATADAPCPALVSATEVVRILGIPAILLEVIDVEDPVEVGGETTYIITATNQGSATGTNVTILCTLEPNAQYVSSSGATIGTVVANTIRFAPLPELAAKDEASWKVNVKAVQAGDVRFRVSMTSDQLGRPVAETEATNFYE